MSISRRSFLKGAAAASLAVAASGILTGCSGITGGLTGGAYVSGAKTGTFKVADGKTITVALDSVQYVDVYDELALTMSISNTCEGAAILTETKSNAGKYVIVPSVSYVGVSGKDFDVDTGKSTIYNKDVAKDKTEKGILVLKPEDETEWTAVKLTLTLVNGNDQKDIADVAPITFTIKK